MLKWTVVVLLYLVAAAVDQIPLTCDRYDAPCDLGSDAGAVAPLGPTYLQIFSVCYLLYLLLRWWLCTDKGFAMRRLWILIAAGFLTSTSLGVYYADMDALAPVSAYDDSPYEFPAMLAFLVAFFFSLGPIGYATALIIQRLLPGRPPSHQPPA